MKAGVLHGNNDIRFEDIDKPSLDVRDVLVRVKYCGICGSDVPRVFEGTSKYYPNILGHEFSGTVESSGSKVTSCKTGDQVAGIPLIPCGSCAQCKSGNFALCGQYGFIGSRQFGAFAEYVVVPESNIYKLTSDADLRTASLFEPATVALHAFQRFDFESGSTVAVVGGGTIGLLMAQIAQAAGASNVIVFGRRQERLAIASSVGISKTINTSEKNWRNYLNEEFGLSDFNYVFETAGSSVTIVQAIDLAGPKGKVCFVGTPKTETSFSVDQWEQINRKELCLTGSWMSYSAPWPGREWEEVERMFNEGKLIFSDEMIYKEFPLCDIHAAFDLFYPKNRALGKVLINCD